MKYNNSLHLGNADVSHLETVCFLSTILVLYPVDGHWILVHYILFAMV